MLTKCPECNLQVSDRAIVCPHCGCPLSTNTMNTSQKVKKKSHRRKRLPNGFGQISEIKNSRLRKPFRARITIGKTDQGKFITKTLGYFETYNEAYAALIEYNKNPYDLNTDGMTVADLYESWSKQHFANLKSDVSVRTIESAWKYCSSVYNMRVKDLRARHIKGCMENGTAVFNGKEHHPSAAVKDKIKTIFNLMLDYAVEYEIVDKNYSRTFTVSNDTKEELKTKNGHIPFTDEEMEKLWDNVDTIPYVDLILIQCYSGWRPQELGLIRLENVDLENWTFTGGMKTDAGINRIVPIHSRIRDFVKIRYDEAVELGSEYLFNTPETPDAQSKYNLTYMKYRARFKKICTALKLNPEHRAHDGRVHFVTQAKKYNVDEYAIKYMVGHAITDVTEKAYTQRDVSWLSEEIEKIK